MGFLIGLVLVFGAIFAITYFLSQKEKKRVVLLRELAQKLHMKFHENGVAGWDKALGNLKFFQTGENKKFFNTLEGRIDETSLLISDYAFETRSNTGHRSEGVMSHQVTVIILDKPELSLPAFEMQPMSQAFRLVRTMNSDDIIFENTPAFSEKYYLKGDDRKAVRSLFDHQKLTFFMTSPEFSIEGKGTQLLFHNSTINTPSSRIEVDRLESRLKACIEVAKIFME